MLSLRLYSNNAPHPSLTVRRRGHFSKSDIIPEKGSNQMI
jgi:hypothetical protein